MNTIRKIEIFVLAVILGLIMPILGLLIGWWGAIPFLPEKMISSVALAGLILGLLADAVFLKRVVQKAHQMDIRIWAAIYLFYSLGVFGLFMGVPVFNVALAIPAGFVIGGRLVHEMVDGHRVRTTACRTCILTTVLIAFICAASAFIALASPSTPADLEGMLGLPFTVTPAMIWGIILVGGTGLLAVNWVLTALSFRFTYHFLRIS
jgi:hypothetical protein